MTIETTNVSIPTINLQVKMPNKNPKTTMMNVVFEDKDLIRELGHRCNNDIKIPKNTYDIN
jgi:hypothetical protein